MIDHSSAQPAPTEEHESRRAPCSARVSIARRMTLMRNVSRRELLSIAAATGAVAFAAPARGDAPAQFSPDEIIDNGQRFFGSVSKGLADGVQEAGRRWGLPNAYILGQEASGA